VCAQQFGSAIARAYGEGMQGNVVRLVAIPGYVPPWLHRPAAAMLLAQGRPDIVHTHLNPAARRIGVIAQRLGIPRVLTLHLDYDAHEHASIDGLVALHAKQREQIPPEFAGEVAGLPNAPRSMRLVPIVGRSRVDLERHRERDGREWRLFHYLLDHRKCAGDLVFRHFEDELVVNLQQHLR
jgi:hypothetical protein